MAMGGQIALLPCVSFSTLASIFWFKIKDPQFASANWDEIFLNGLAVSFPLCLRGALSVAGSTRAQIRLYRPRKAKIERCVCSGMPLIQAKTLFLWYLLYK